MDEEEVEHIFEEFERSLEAVPFVDSPPPRLTGDGREPVSLGQLAWDLGEYIESGRWPARRHPEFLRRTACVARRRAPRILCAARARRSPASTRRATTDSGGSDPESPRPSLSPDRFVGGCRMSAPTIDVRGALGDAGIKYRRSGTWTRIRAEWRSSRDFNISISATGGWHDHATGDHGGWAALADRLGLGSVHKATYHRPRLAPASPCKTSDRTQRARIFWQHASPDLAAYAYLKSRGPGVLEAATRAGARSRLAWHEGVDKACVVWPIYDLRSGAHGGLIGVQREWGRGHTNKKMLGRHMVDGTSGGFIIPAGASDSTLYVVEGPITGCAVAAASGCAVAVMYDTAGLSAVPVALAEHYKHIIIAADNDKSGAGEKAATAAAHRILLRHPGTRIQITMPEPAGADWADILEHQGPEAVRAALVAGLRDPEPPPRGGKIIPLVPWEKTERAPAPLHEVVDLVKAEIQVRDAIQKWEEQGGGGEAAPVVINITPGAGKTHILIEIVKQSQRPFLILCPTLDHARSVAAQIPGAALHKGRGADNCKRYVTVAALTSNRRSPHAHACLDCPHGAPDADAPCEYMPALRSSVYHRVVVAAHGAGAEESLLYSCDHMNKANSLTDRGLVCDESPAVNISTTIVSTHIQEWRAGVARAEMLLDGEERRVLAGEHCEQDSSNARARLRGVEKARAWVRAVAPELDRLALALAGAPADRALHKIIGFDELARLASKVPAGARHIDATIIESVDLRHAQTPIIPLKAIETLGQALKAGTAFFEEGTIVCMTTGALWKQIIRRGGLLLDATPSLRQVKEVEAMGGTVVTVRVEQPHLRIIQYGPRLHGRGGLANGGAVREAALLEQVRGDAVAITHKPIKTIIDNERVRHWGIHKAHNDWKGEDRLVLHGLPLLSPRDQKLQYAADRAALAVVGVEWADWDGSASAGPTVETDGWRVRSAARLPTCPDARAWLLDRLAADVAQAIGRLRAVRRTEPVTVEIYGLLPLVGHGIRINEFRHEREGWAADNIKTRAAVAAGVIHMDEHTTRWALSDFVLRQSGRRISNTTIDCILDEIKAAALARGITLAQACAALLATAERLLDAHGGDAVAALAEVAGTASASELLLWACAHEPLTGPRAAQGP